MMFSHCKKLTGLPIALPELVDGTGMFGLCSAFAEEPTSLPKLEIGCQMFHYCAIEEWNVDMPNLLNATEMFSQCERLRSFNADTPKLMFATRMFRWHSQLTSFRGNLQSLVDGEGMFQDSMLDIQSVQNISETIGTVDDGIISLGVSQECHDNPLFDSLLETISGKGWTVSCQINLSQT